jgi:hypothetical protein
MRAELKVPHAHPIKINIEESSREEAIEAGFHHSMMHFSCIAHFSASLHGTFGFWAYKGNDSVIAYLYSCQKDTFVEVVGVLNKQINQGSVQVKETDHDGCKVLGCLP